MSNLSLCHRSSFTHSLLNRVSVIVRLLLLTLAFCYSATAQSPGSQFFQGFEVNDVWGDPPSDPNRVASGTNGITSKTGGFHAEALAGDFTRWGGYNATFPAHGYVTRVAIYLNVGGGFANDTRFDFISAISNPANSHRRDFVFNAGYYNDSDITGSGPRFVVSASTNAGRANSFPKNPGRDPFAITTSGWYTFKHRFYNNSGVLAVELSIVDSSNVTIHTWTISDPTDMIPANVGGNRYGWFSSIEFPFLAIDDSERANILITIPVDDDGMASATDCDAADVASTTIGAAMTAAAAGDTIKVCPGTYPEAVSVSKAVTVLGANANVTGYGVRTAESIVGNSTGAFNITANNAVVNGFTAEGNTNSAFYDAGIIIGANTSGVQVLYSIIQNNILGINLGGDNSVIQYNLIQNNNNAGSASGHGIYTDEYSAGGAITNVLIDSNVFVGHDDSGIGLSSVSIGGSQSNFTISNNEFSGNGRAMYLFNLVSSSITNNNIHDSTEALTADIRIFEGNDNLTISGNTIRNGAGRGVRINNAGYGSPNSQNITLSFNRIVGNAVAGVVVDAGQYTGTLAAQNNWWGCNYGPGAGGAGCIGTPNTFVGPGTSTPWLTLTTAAVPNNVVFGGMSAVTSSLTINSATVNTSGSGFVLNGTPASFVGTLGSVAPPASTTTSGVTGTNFTAGATEGVGGVATTIDGQTVNAPIAVYAAACADVSIPDVQSLTGVVATIPVNTSEMTTRGAISADFTVNYNPAVLTPDATPTFGVALGSVGTSNGGGRVLTVSNPSPGTLVISIFGTLEFQGSGPLVNLNFNVIGSPATSSLLTFGSPTFRYNEGSPCVNLTNGSLTVISGTISGTVSYGNVVGLPAAPRHVPNTTLNAAGSIPQSTVTALNGTYSLSGMGAGSYTVTPSKTGGDFGALSGLDSAYIAQYVVGIAPGNAIDATQQIVADVSGAGGISSFDAALIARYVASLPNSGSSGTWIFVPVNRMYPDVNASQSGQDYAALLMGDVTGNWSDPSATRSSYPGPIIPTQEPVSMALGKARVSTGSDFTVPITISSTKGKGIVSYQFDLNYDPSVLRAQPIAVDVSGALSNGMSVTVNSETPGLLKVVVFGAVPLNGEGLLLNLKFTAIGELGSASTITLQNLMLNEGNPWSVSTEGRVEISTPTRKEASVSGRLLSPEGQGVSNVIVRLTNAQGESHTTLSNANGDYHFGGVSVGQSYTVSVESGRFVFSPQTISVDFDQPNINLFARP